MKRTILIITLLAVLLIGADKPKKLIRLTIINKSGMDLSIQLLGEEEEEFYYLQIPEGERGNPTEKSFTIVNDIYQMQPYYIETWDPVYGYSCTPPKPNILYATRNIRVIFTECDRRPPNPGEPSMMKYWIWRWRFIY